MAYNMVVAASEFKGGPVKEVEFPNFPENLSEAVAQFGEEEVYNGWLRSFVIAQQAKMRAKPANGGTRTRSGSPVAQAAAARRKAIFAAIEESKAGEQA